MQRRATRWILQTKKGGMSYKERLLSLNLLPLAYDREIKDLTFFYKAMHGLCDLDVLKFVSFVTHSRTRNCHNPSHLLKIPSCKTNTFKSSYFNRIVLLWNYVCKVALPSDFCSLFSFKTFLRRTYMFFNVFLACAKLHASKVGNWSVFVSVSFFVCVFCMLFLLLATGECLAWDLGSRWYFCRLGSNYPNKVVKPADNSVICGMVEKTECGSELEYGIRSQNSCLIKTI